MSSQSFPRANKVCIHGSDVPLPYGCEEWTLVDDITEDDITPQLLERCVSVRVARDYHGSSIHEHMSLFSAAYNLNEIKYLAMICCEDYLSEYVDPRTGGNIFHAVVINPNPYVMMFMSEFLGDELTHILMNSLDSNGRRPIELIGYDRDHFEQALHYTDMDDKYREYLLDKCPVAKVFI